MIDHLGGVTEEKVMIKIKNGCGTGALGEFSYLKVVIAELGRKIA